MTPAAVVARLPVSTGASIALLLAIGLLRLVSLWSHDPLYAYANTYDQVRYTACFDLYPDRSARIPPSENSPWAPYSHYRFIRTPAPFCYWSSELAFQAVNAGIYHLVEAFGGGESHSVRSIGALRILALLALVGFFVRAALRAGDSGLALTHAALFAVLWSDPANTLYLNGFYAEWTTLLAAYAVFGLLFLWRDRVVAPLPALVLGLLAFALAFSKIQHVVLPLVLGGAVWLLDRFWNRQPTWRAWALIVGGLCGVFAQGVQLGRGGSLMDAIRIHNQTHVVLTGLLPYADDKPALLAEMGVAASCLEYVGRHAWQLPGSPEEVCPGVADFGRGKQLGILLRHPELGLRLFGHGVLALHPWIPPDIGQVENLQNADIPASVPNLGAWLRAVPFVFFALLALPWLAVPVLLARRDGRRGRGFDYTVLTCVAMVATLGVTILGDGLADTRKQGHLVGNAAIAFAIVVLAGLARSWWERSRRS